MNEWLRPSEIADLKLPCLPKTKQGVNVLVLREDWRSRQNLSRNPLARRCSDGRGGAWEYHYSLFPKTARREFERLFVNSELSSVKTIAPASMEVAQTESCCALKDWQRKVRDSRLAIIQKIKQIAETTGVKQAEATFVVMAANKTLPDGFSNLVAYANARKGKLGKRTVSAVTLRRWRRLFEDDGPAGLVPRPSRAPRQGNPDWLPAFLELYRTPAKQSISACYDFLSANIALPSLRTVERELNKLSQIERNRGRMGPRELKALRTFVARDVADLWPGAVYVSDGHCFDAEVAHPLHGRPFRPEITGIIDVFTRRLVGWSAALAENTFGVMDAARHAFELNGLCDIWYVDNGAGFNNAAFDAELTGFLARLSITKKNSLPYNSQARGVIERLHQSLWVRAAKTLPTYIGADMDREARQKAFKATREDIKRIGVSSLMMAWPEFLVFCQAQIDAYNSRPHSSLRKIRDSQSGKRRHMTPDEAWSEACQVHGHPDRLTEEDSLDLSRPQERRVTKRGLVSVFGNSYFSQELEHWYGKEVLVGYDIHDASKVWIRNLDQQLICVAEFEGNKTSFFPLAAVEAAKTKRLQGRLKRNAAQREEIEAEGTGQSPIEQRPIQLFAPEQLAEARQTVELLITPKKDRAPVFPVTGRPIFTNDLDLARWLIANPSAATQNDKLLLRDLMRSNAFRMQLDCAGISAGTLEQIARKEIA